MSIFFKSFISVEAFIIVSDYNNVRGAMKEIIMNTKQSIGRRIKVLRRKRGLSQEEVASKADISPNYVSRMERGTENPTLDMLIKISEALNVELWELFDYKYEVNLKALKEMLRHLINEIIEEDELKIAVRVMRAIAR
jgi:transcriptional regulator with XRE-family HTH domain